MTTKFNKKGKNNQNKYYRIFDKNNDNYSGVNYEYILNIKDFEIIIENFFEENHLASIVHAEIFSSNDNKTNYVTLIGSKQIMQISEDLYLAYQKEIENKLKETMNYELIKDLIDKDTEFILNICSSGVIYSDQTQRHIKKVYACMLNYTSIKLLKDVLYETLSDSNSQAIINFNENKNAVLTCGEASMILNDKGYCMFLNEILDHNRKLNNPKVLEKK